MMRFVIFLWFFISNLIAASINSLTSDKNEYNLGDTAKLYYSISDEYRYKLKFTAYDANNNKISPLNFSAVTLGETDFIIPSDYQYNTIKIVLDLIDKNGVVDSKDILLNIVSCQDEIELGSGDDIYYRVNIPFSFHGYTIIYPNTNGYITFNRGTTQYSNYVRAFYPMIWTSSSDLMTHVYIQICSNYVKIRWSGGYFPNWNGSFSSWVILNADGSIEQSSGDYYGF